ncbi:MAG: RloB domain-containing protein [Chloroflexi bacterium]|nr:MAG: RloB domain-containing protein [Chloroflexota bacterium]
MARTPKPSGRKKLPDKGRPLRRRRRVDHREKRRRFLIVCEGTRTEPNYFRRFKGSAIDVEVVGIGRDPLAVIEKARELNNEEQEKGIPYDEVWVVFDKNGVPAEQFNRAIHSAKQAGFHPAYSNQAFELWYVLHFEYLNVAIPRRQYQKRLDKLLGRRYRKNDPSLYDVLLPKQGTALRNAKRLLASYPQHNPAQDDPCTTVHLLVEALNRAT